MATTKRTILAVYLGEEELIPFEPLGEPVFVVDGTMDEAKLAAKNLWSDTEELFGAEEEVDPDWSNEEDKVYACSPSGYWMAIKPITLRVEDGVANELLERLDALREQAERMHEAYQHHADWGDMLDEIDNTNDTLTKYLPKP